MASDITTGRYEPEKKQVGGLKAVYFINGSTNLAVTYTGDAVSAVTDSPICFKYYLKGTQNKAGLGDTVSSRDNGTTYFKQTLELTLKQLTQDDHLKVRQLAVQSPKVIVQDNNDNYFILGIARGLECTGGTIVTGGALGDLSGYTLNFEGEELKPANFLTGTPTAIGFTVIDID